MYVCMYVFNLVSHFKTISTYPHQYPDMWISYLKKKSML